MHSSFVLLLYNKCGTLTRFSASYSLWQGFERSAGFLHPLTAELMETQKYQNFQTKFGRARGNFFFFWLHQERKSGHSGKALYFSDENPEKLMKGMLFYFLNTNLQSDSRVPIFLAIELQQCFLILCFYALHWPFGN